MQSKPVETTSSGTSDELPGILAYPPLLKLVDVPEMKGQYVYVIRGYPDEGFSIVIKRDPKNDRVRVLTGDFSGNNIAADSTLDGRVAELLAEKAPTLIAMLKLVGVQQIILYFAAAVTGLVLVDVRLSLDKFCGPGMVRDLFSKVLPIQEVVKIVQLDEPTLADIEAGVGEFAGPLILKCSMFKTMTRNKDLLPLYAVVRQT